MSAASKIIEARDCLEKANHKVIIPRNTELYANGSLSPESRSESTENKIKCNLLKTYFDLIKSSDAVLVINEAKEGVKNYIGGNTFLEMGFAHVLGKKLFLLNEIPDMFCKDEIKAMQPIVLNGDLDKVTEK